MNNSSATIVMDAFAENGLPVFCFPEMIEKMPMSLTYCFLYLLGCALTMAFGFYVYYKKKLEYKLKNNGHSLNRQNSTKQSNDVPLLPRLLRRRSNSPEEVYKKVASVDGGQ
jgi:hypothetical protein